VSLISAAVLELARLRRLARHARERRQHQPDGTQRLFELLAARVPGRSFADVGGMFGIDGDVAFRAEAAGAREVTLFDAADPSQAFKDRAARTGSKIKVVQGDLEDPVSIAALGTHEIVWCKGVIYHTPNPVQQLLHLRQITTELLIIGSATIPEVPGFPQACVYYPYLSRNERKPFARGLADPAMSIGVGTPYDPRPMYGHGNFWWGITPSALRAMVQSAGFDIIEEIAPPTHPWGTDLVAVPRPDFHSPMPPVEFFRVRAERLASGTPPPFHGYYEKGPDAVATAEDAFPDLKGLPKLDALDLLELVRRRVSMKLRRRSS
jgi:hypothetical protein